MNSVIANRGGLALAWGNMSEVLQLPIAGLMSDADSLQVTSRYSRLERRAKELGSPMTAPFITLSFMALLVIPHLKMSDKGLFDADSFLPTKLFE